MYWGHFYPKINPHRLQSQLQNSLIVLHVLDPWWYIYQSSKRHCQRINPIEKLFQLGITQSCSPLDCKPQLSILSLTFSAEASMSLSFLNPSSDMSCFAIKFFSIRHSRYFFEKRLHFSDWWPKDFRQLRYSFFSRSHKCMWSKGKTPFSGGTGLSPLFPPNAPPALICNSFLTALCDG